MSELVSNIADFASGLRTLHVPDIECSLQPMGREYIVGDRAVTPATDVLLGQMEVIRVEEGLVLYRTTAKDLCTMRTSNLLYPGLKIVLLLEGESELAYGELRLRLRAGVPAQCAAVVALARTERFMRQWREGRRERKLVLTLSPQWLQAAGIAQGTMQDFLGRHLAHVAWQPSARALAIADQLHRGRALPAHLQRLWHHSRCLDLVLEALASVDLPPDAVRAAPRGMPPRLHLRLAALRNWLMTPAADGMDTAAIARHAGISRAHLQRHFPAVADGLSLGQFVRAQRLLRARNGLEQGQLSVAKAAQLAGYRSSTHFAAVFFQHFGLRPSQAKPVLPGRV
ncbi:helix-turn-helix transcriptional regulator [Comamonas sp. CAH-2]|jgi:AraC-like DNA-binding protein|uniref:helix-turn-helix transcriptional regulator n=1 Tax=Comamonas sp. CAH-2 TaxID=2605745 RepID=UPI0012AD6B15|nr:helix-turn-helix transcriptional regulator [Comamonas sp. CAH-2]MRT22306.1 helix-turn-helix transcriptional regulator [Comamonas sp. CAH-2]